MLKDVKLMVLKKILVFGSKGKLGCVICEYVESYLLENFEYYDVDIFDILDIVFYENIDWDLYGIIINVVVYIFVDGVEMFEGCKVVWIINVCGVRNFVKIVIEYRIILVYIFSDYVFDGIF